jgi:hypothetical protein
VLSDEPNRRCRRLEAHRELQWARPCKSGPPNGAQDVLERSWETWSVGRRAGLLGVPPRDEAPARSQDAPDLGEYGREPGVVEVMEQIRREYHGERAVAEGQCVRNGIDASWTKELRLPVHPNDQALVDYEGVQRLAIPGPEVEERPPLEHRSIHRPYPRPCH